jgi:hypothetical protein
MTAILTIYRYLTRFVVKNQAKVKAIEINKKIKPCGFYNKISKTAPAHITGLRTMGITVIDISFD